jgi:hypothetical protein
MARSLGRAVFVLALLWSADAAAYSASGRHWANTAGQPITYRIDPAATADITDGSAITAVNAAFQTWQSVSCTYLSFTSGMWMDPKVVGNDGVNRVFWKTAMDGWTESQATIALTYTFFRTTDNVITDADITINNVNWSFTTDPSKVGMGTPAKVDVQSVVVHEVGHFFGLDHSTDPTAVMYGTNNQPIKRMLAEDDIEAICSLYSNGMPVPNVPGGPTMMGGPVGAPCKQMTDCASGICANDGAVMRVYCTEKCTPGTQGTCPAGFACTPAAGDNYCLVPDTIDEICDPCMDGSQCASGFCVSVPMFNMNMGFCTRPCDPTPGQPAQCPQGYSCTAVEGQTGGACTPNTGVCEPVGRGGQDQPCFPSGGCNPGYTCIEYFPMSGLNYCYFDCNPMDMGQSCTFGGGTICTPTMMTNVDVCFDEVGPGQRCIPAICDSTSLCAYDETQGIASALCYRKCANGVGDCQAHEQCQAFTGLGNLCVPLDGFKVEGESCASDSECRSSLCRTYGVNKLCTSMCSTTDPMACGPGLKCLPQSGSTQGLCWPTALQDPNAPSPTTRTVTTQFCACDVTNHCDSNCPCDPECAGGCHCGELVDGSSPGIGLALLFVLAMSSRCVRRSR